MDFSFIVMWLMGAFSTCGLIQWIKGFIPLGYKDKIPSWVWGVILPGLCIAWSAAPSWLQAAWGILALTQLGYENIVQVIKKKLEIGQ